MNGKMQRKVSLYHQVQINLQTDKTEATFESNETKKRKAANGKTLSSHQKWFRERKFRDNVI